MNEPIKICFVAPYAYSLFNKSTNYVFGGSEVRAWLLGTGLAKQTGFEVSFAVFDHGQPSVEYYNDVAVYSDAYFGRVTNQSLGQLSELVKRAGNIVNRIRSKIVPPPCIHIDSHSIPENKFRTYRQIDADVYCTFGVGNFSAELVAFTKKHKKKTLLFIGSGGDLNIAYHTQPDGLNDYGSLNSLCAYTLQHVDTIVCQGIGQQVALMSLFDRKSVVIKNPIKLDVPSYSKNNDKRMVVLWIGKSDHIKRPNLFVELAKKNPGNSFTMIMNRSNPVLHSQIMSQAPANLKIIEYVHFNEIEKYFAEAHLFVNTSKFEGFPNTFLQAGKYALPILSLDVDPNGYILEYDCGVCAGGDIEVLSKSLQIFLSSQDLYDRCSANSRKYVQENHDLQEKVKELGNEISKIKSSE